MKKWVSLILGMGVSVVIFALLIGSDIEEITTELSQARYGFLLPGGVLFIIGIWTRAVRWRILLNNQIPVKHSFHIINIGYFASGILPLRLGDVARAWLTTRLDKPIAGFTALSTIVVERLLDLLAVLAMLGFSLLLLDVPSELASAGVVLGVMALGGGIVLAIFAAKPHWAHRILAVILNRIPMLKRFKLEAMLTHLLDGIQPMSQPRIAVNALLWTAISWAFSVAAGFVFLYTIFPDPTLAATLAFIVLGSFSVALPAVPGNLGPFEGAVVGGLWIAGMISSAGSPENAPAVAFAGILHAVMLGIYIVLGLVGLYYEQASLGQLRDAKETLQQPKPHLTEIVHERAS